MDKMLENKPLARRNHKGKCCFLHGCSYGTDSSCSVGEGRVIQRHRCSKCSTPADVLARGLKGEDVQLEARGYLSPALNNIFLKWGSQPMVRASSTAVLAVEDTLSSTEKLDRLATAAQEASMVVMNFRYFEAVSLKQVQEAAAAYDFKAREVKDAQGKVVALAYVGDKLVEEWMPEVALSALTDEDVFTTWKHKREVFSRSAVKAEAERRVRATEPSIISSMDAINALFFIFSIFGLLALLDRGDAVRDMKKVVKAERKAWWALRQEVAQVTGR